MKRIKHLKVLSIAVAFILVFSVVFPLYTRAENSSEEKFTAEQSINGTKVTVSADPEVFPEGTTMEVKEVNLTSTEDSLVASQQQADQKSIKKVALDITMKNKEGQEIEPDTSKGKVHVSFTNDDIKNHTTNVYHIDDNLKVESLKLTKSDDTVTGETTGFSTYVIDFTYDSNKVYYIYDTNPVDVSTLMKSILTPDQTFNETKITNVRSDQSSVTVAKANNKWQVTVNPSTSKEFDQLATLTITYNGKNYTLKVNYGASWLSNFDYDKDDTKKTVTLRNFIGNVKSISIYPTVIINNETYTVQVSRARIKKKWNSTTDKNGKTTWTWLWSTPGGLFSNSQYDSPKAANLEEINFVEENGKTIKYVDPEVDKSYDGSLKMDFDLSNYFYNATSLKKVDLSGLDTSNVENMASMFQGTTSLTNNGKDSYLIFNKNNTQYFTTRNVKNMYSMFMSTGLEKLDLSSFETSKVTELSNLASNNKNLKEIDLSSFEGAKSEFYGAWSGAGPYVGPLHDDPKLERVILGSSWEAVDNTTYIGLGLTGNWQNVQSSYVYTNEELDQNYTSSMAGTYIRTSLAPTSLNDPLYVADGFQKEKNMWEVHTPDDKFRAYCLDFNRAAPVGYFDKVKIDLDATAENKKPDKNGHSNYIMDYLDADTGYREIAPNMAKALVTLIYYSNFRGENNQYDQHDIWHFTNHYSRGINGDVDAPNLAEKIKNHTYDDLLKENVGKTYSLYIYVPSVRNMHENKESMQNLLSIEGANEQPYAGVQVKKVDNNSNGLFGAKFKVTRKDGSVITNGKTSLEFTTNSAGIGGIYRMDRTSGLPAGEYTLTETDAPAGYELNKNNSYDFTVYDTDDQKVITVGNNDKVIINNPKNDWHGGGLTLKKVDANTGVGLQNAEFTLYRVNDDNTETEVNKYTTDSSGVLYTGNKEIEIGKKYVLKETKAPDGYVNANFSKEITLSSNNENKYFELGSITNSPKTGSVILTGKKILKNSNETLKEGQFTFRLYDSSRNPIGDPVGNKADGSFEFNSVTDTKLKDYLNFTAADMPGKTFYIKEVIPTNADASLDYDTHEERVQVLISDDGSDTLKCELQKDNDGITFVNTSKVDYRGKLTVKKTVKDSFGDVVQGNSGESFDFYLNLLSDTADLDTKTFNYTIDGKSGTFKFNKAGTTEDGKTKYRSQSSFKLSNGSKLELTKLPVGSTYEVTEDHVDGYTSKSINATNTISAEGTEVTFINEANRIIPTSADTMTRMSFWILGTAGALVFVLILKRRLKASKK